MMLAATGNDYYLLNRIESIMGMKKKMKFPVKQFIFSLGIVFIAALFNFYFSVSGNSGIIT